MVLILGVMLGTTNAVNLTDGLDGLAGGSVAIAAVSYAVIAGLLGRLELALLPEASPGRAWDSFGLMLIRQPSLWVIQEPWL